MVDDKTKKDGRDDSQVSSSDINELSYLEEKLGISREEVQQAIAAVGTNREKVEEYLRKNRG